jgi:hypothetical protein
VSDVGQKAGSAYSSHAGTEPRLGLRVVRGFGHAAFFPLKTSTWLARDSLPVPCARHNRQAGMGQLLSLVSGVSNGSNLKATLGLFTFRRIAASTNRATCTICSRSTRTPRSALALGLRPHDEEQRRRRQRHQDDAAGYLAPRHPEHAASRRTRNANPAGDA